MLDRTNRKAIIAVARAAGLSPGELESINAVLDDGPRKSGEPGPLLVNQAQAARLISGSRFLVRRLVKDGKLRQIFLTPDCVRYSQSELENLANGGTNV